MSILDWLFGKAEDRLIEMIDLPFIQSELKEINLTDEEICERAAYDSLATEISERGNDSGIPIGKQVF